jgi:hypothetical protein
MHVEEPRQGIQFGVRLDAEDPPSARRAKVKVRDNSSGEPVPPEDDFTAANSIAVPFRRNAPGVINLGELRKRLAGKAPHAVDPLPPNEFALQMLRFPYRQVFGDPDDREGVKFFDPAKFQVTIPLTSWQTTITTQLEKVKP